MSATDLNVRQALEVIRLTRGADVEVLEIAGWQSRGHPGNFFPRGVLDHHDASTLKSFEWGSLGYITREVLSQFQGARCLDGVPKVALVAAGRCWHAGLGGPTSWCPKDSANTYAYGVEWANNGLGEPYTPAAQYAKRVLHRAILEVVT